MPCKSGSYQSAEGQTFCIRCPPHLITTYEGAHKFADCIENCLAGNYYDYNHRRCESCDVGFYQPSRGRTSCFPCPAGTNTLNRGSKSASDCTLTCDDGEEFGPDGHCVRCSKGSYKAAGEMSACVSCPLGFSTPSDGAKDVSECTLLYCPPGKYATASVCQPCGIGFYQNLYNSSYCKPCPQGMTTSKIGASSVEHCYGKFKLHMSMFLHNRVQYVCAWITVLHASRFADA
ncbi:unnamed protein product [Soboliphyme baturini]|uniref:Ephrin_rec_like domain-containing protein n=1 Tax=Soboliphyme baturini TaxID=241478 RepID=A0A183J9W3_9BILA|nr:unnamed protein product [Soboliphyme baturini]